ncbi:hypothetical protein U1Q18_039842, partial [Sarracenia purpurea var. burkii]
DAYALCRVFKKSAPGPKIGEHQYVASASAQMSSDQSSAGIDLYSEGRCEDLDSCDYQTALDPSSRNLNAHGSQLITSGASDENWTRYLSEDVFGVTNNPSFPNSEAISYHPSKVDIALECARLQHRFSLPPLEVQDFPHGGFVDLKMPPSTSIRHGTNEEDILQEILSVAQASQELINNETWGGRTGSFADHHPVPPAAADFSFLTQNDDDQQIHGMHTSSSSSRFMDKSGEDQNSFRSISIRDLDEDQLKSGKMVENLRWVGMSSKDLEKKWLISEELDSRTNFNEFNETEANAFPLEFIDDTRDENFLDDGDVNDFSSPPSFEVYEKVEVNHGMFVSTCQASETFFHQTVPSEIVKVYLNPITMHNSPTLKPDSQTKPKKKSLFGKLTAFVQKKIARARKPWRKTVRPIITITALPLTYFLYFGEDFEEEKLGESFSATSKAMKIMKLKKPEKLNWDYKKKKIWICEEIEKSISSLVLCKIIWPYIAIALAISSIWVHQIATSPN